MSAVNDIWDNINKIIPNLNKSASGICHRLVEVFGTVIDIVRLEMLRSEQIISNSTKISRITSREYYVEKAYKYQENDPLMVINETTQELGYMKVDTNKQIIKQASIGVTSLGIFYLNVASSDSNKNIIQLTKDQLSAFSEYYQNFLAMGVQCTIASNPPAIFTCSNLYIRFYKTYNLDSIKSEVNNTLHNIQLNKRPSSILYINEIETSLSLIEGIKDAYFSNVSIVYNMTHVFPNDGRIVLDTGYFNFDPDIYNFNISKTLFEGV